MRRLALLAFLLLAAPAAAAPHPLQIAQGHTRFGNFAISGYTSGGDLCLSLSASALSDAGCGFPLGPSDAAEPDATGDCGHRRVSYFGATSDRVATVLFRYASGRTLPARVYAIPASVLKHAKVYVAFAASTRGPRWLDSYDAAGHRLQHTRMGSGPCRTVDPFKGTPVVASGQAPDGGDYQLRAARARDDLGRRQSCVGIRERHKKNGPIEDVGGNCLPRIGSDDAVLGLAGSCSSPAQTFYFGFVVPAARAVALELDNGQVLQGTLYPSPRSMHTTDSLVLAAVSGGHEVRSVTGYNAAGATVFSHKVVKLGVCKMGGTFNAGVDFVAG
jgi:hypothetical protein